MTSLRDFALGVPKAELHVHIEGTLEPDMMFEMAERNEIALPFGSVEEIRKAYNFSDLQSFLDIYYEGAAVLRTAEDFGGLMGSYLRRAAADGVKHAEVFFDPQTHTERGVGFETFIAGFDEARKAASEEHGISCLLIMCFLRHLPVESAMATIEAAIPFRSSIAAVGLDSSEVGYPPELFTEPFQRAAELGWRRVAHAGEEGPSSYIAGALDSLGAERIDHGVALTDDPELLERVAAEGIPLTMCPLSNVKLRVFDSLEEHNLAALLEAGVVVTINSDDPSYFGGYIGAAYAETAAALQLDKQQVASIAINSFRASFLDDDDVERHVAAVEGFLSANS